MKRTTRFTNLALLLIVAGALALAGCGGDDNGSSVEETMLPAEPPVAEPAEPPDTEPADQPYDPSQPGGTREGAEGRAAAQRIADSVGMVLVKDAVIEDQNADPPITAAEAMPAVMGYGIRPGASIESLSQTRLGEPAMLSIAVTGGTGLGTADDSADMDAPAIAGYTGVSLMKDGPGAITQMALVYSDAERSVRAFGDVYRYNTDVDDNGTGLRPAPLTEAQRMYLNIGSADEATADANVSLNHGLSTTTGEMTRGVAGTDEPNMVRGTYDDVAGQYRFIGEGDITLDADGETVTIVGVGNVLFRADNAETLLPDSDYLAFGVWTEVPDSPTLANPGKVRPFVHGSAGAFKRADIMGLNGSASYSGGAVGHYATRAAGSHMADQGRFTADASLAANFDGGAEVMLTGMIDGFMSEDGMAMDGWLVNLNGGSMLAGTRDSDIAGMTSGTAGSQAWSGVWDAWLFGANKDTYPTGVAGRFQAVAGTAQPMTTSEARIDLYADEGFAGVVGSFAGRR